VSRGADDVLGDQHVSPVRVGSNTAHVESHLNSSTTALLNNTQPPSGECSRRPICLTNSQLHKIYSVSDESQSYAWACPHLSAVNELHVLNALNLFKFYSLGGSSDAAFRCQYCNNLFVDRSRHKSYSYRHCQQTSAE